MTAHELIRLLEKILDEVAAEHEQGDDTPITIRGLRSVLAVAAETVPE